MTIFSAAVTTATPSDPAEWGELLNHGQMGLALAFLLIGSGLFTTALLKDKLNDTFASVLKFFGAIMLILFLTSFAGEMVATYMEFDLKRHPPDGNLPLAVVGDIKGIDDPSLATVTVVPEEFGWAPQRCC